MNLVYFAIILIFTTVNCDVISTNVSLTKFYLWTRDNPDFEQELIFDDLESVQNSNFHSEWPTKVLVHGYTGNGKQSWVLQTRDNYLSQGNIYNFKDCHTGTNHFKMFINSPLLISQVFPLILRKSREIRNLFTFYNVTSINFTKKSHFHI